MSSGIPEHVLTLSTLFDSGIPGVATSVPTVRREGAGEPVGQSNTTHAHVRCAVDVLAATDEATAERGRDGEPHLFQVIDPSP